MKDVQRPDHISLALLVNRLKEGQFVIPDFQREFEWKPSDVSELMRSIFLDYYIGSLLLWKGKPETFKALSCEPLYGFAGGGKPTYIVLDGQQRLTAMYYAFIAPKVKLPNRKNRYIYFIRVDKFVQEEYDEAFDYDWTQWGERLLSDRKVQFENHIFPLDVVGAGGWEMHEWMRGYIDYCSSKGDGITEKQIREFGEHVRGIVDQYQVAYIELDQDLQIDKVCDIFTQINSRGVRLDVFDLMNALLKPSGIQLKHLWRETEKRIKSLDVERLNVYVLQVMSLLRQGYSSPRYLYFLLPGQARKVRESDGSLRSQILVSDSDDFLKLWEQAVKALKQALELLSHPREFGVLSSDYLPYESILPPLAAAIAAIETYPHENQLAAKAKLRRWYWASVFTNRYSGSVESTSARDFQDLTRWFDKDEEEPRVIADFKSQFNQLDLRGVNKRGMSVYNGVLNLLVVNGARDWLKGDILQLGNVDEHHIVPASQAKELRKGDSADSILNRTLLASDTNRRLRDRLPNEYLPELIRQNGEDKVYSIFASHLISPAALEILMRKPFKPADFDAFLQERRRAILEAIQSLLVEDRVGLEPSLRALDQAVEHVEVTLRQLISDKLGGDTTKLPSHVQEKVNSRLLAARKKGVLHDDNHYETLVGKLEFADLRDLQDIVMNNATYSLFKELFQDNKQMLERRFDQLAELRNAIRHTRTVSEVVKREGEAAVHWFSQRPIKVSR